MPYHLAMSPRKFVLERETGFEPATSTLARLHSTTELLPRGVKKLIGDSGNSVNRKNGCRRIFLLCARDLRSHEFEGRHAWNRTLSCRDPDAGEAAGTPCRRGGNVGSRGIRLGIRSKSGTKRRDVECGKACFSSPHVPGESRSCAGKRLGPEDRRMPVRVSSSSGVLLRPLERPGSCVPALRSTPERLFQECAREEKERPEALFFRPFRRDQSFLLSSARCFFSSSSRRARRSTLPTMDLGSSSRNSKMRGTL